MVRLYGVEKKNPPGRREGVAAMKKRLMVSLAVLMALWGGRALAQSARGEQRFRPEQPIEHARSAQQGRKAPSASFTRARRLKSSTTRATGWSQVTIGGGVTA